MIQNIKRDASIIGAAGSGKTESVVYNFMQHCSKQGFSGVIHDYKDFEITEMAYPLFKAQEIPFYIISFDTIYHRVNPIAAKYMENEEWSHYIYSDRVVTSSYFTRLINASRDTLCCSPETIFFKVYVFESTSSSPTKTTNGITRLLA